MVIMDLNADLKMEDDIFPKRLRILYGTIMIVLGIVSMIVTYKYVVPIGSMLLIIVGLALIFWRRWKRMVCEICRY